jgi:hypothetical protein
MQDFPGDIKPGHRAVGTWRALRGGRGGVAADAMSRLPWEGAVALPGAPIGPESLRHEGKSETRSGAKRRA